MDSLCQLPPEMWLKIFSHIPSFDLFSSVSHSSPYLHRLVSFHRSSLPCLRVNIRVWSESNGGMDKCRFSSLTFVISVHDNDMDIAFKDYSKGIYRGNERRLKVLYVIYSKGGQMMAELENREGSIEKIDNSLMMDLLSWMEVSSLRLEVNNENDDSLWRRDDDLLFNIFQWMNDHCQRVSLRHVTLTSHNSSFEWKPNVNSIQLLRSLPLLSLTIENMPSLDILSAPIQIPSLFLRVSHTQRRQRERQLNRIIFYDMDVSYLASLLTSPFPIHHELYPQIPFSLSSITANSLADFILIWRSLPPPKSKTFLCFNSIVSLSDFRSVFPSKGLHHILEEVP
ncbi:hypothetical protein PFISCL1PPCAC_10461, partial [Pristionchus fissidentatus]